MAGLIRLPRDGRGNDRAIAGANGSVLCRWCGLLPEPGDRLTCPWSRTIEHRDCHAARCD